MLVLGERDPARPPSNCLLSCGFLTPVLNAELQDDTTSTPPSNVQVSCVAVRQQPCLGSRTMRPRWCHGGLSRSQPVCRSGNRALARSRAGLAGLPEQAKRHRGVACTAVALEEAASAT